MKKDEILNDLELICGRLRELDEDIRCPGITPSCGYCNNYVVCRSLDTAIHSLYMAINYMKFR